MLLSLALPLTPLYPPICSPAMPPYAQLCLYVVCAFLCHPLLPVLCIAMYLCAFLCLPVLTSGVPLHVCGHEVLCCGHGVHVISTEELQLTIEGLHSVEQVCILCSGEVQLAIAR